MIDKHDMKSFEDEYMTLALAELTDDVTSDMTTLQTRDKRLQEITEEVGEPVAEAWQSLVNTKAREVGLASGKPFED